MKIEIKELTQHDIHDFTELLKVFKVVFDMGNVVPQEKHLVTVLAQPGFIALAAKHDDKVIGGLTVHILPNYVGVKPIAFVHDMAVLTDYQRKAVGSKLIAHLIAYCKANDFEHAFVQAETDDLDAVKFYRSTPISSELQAIHFTYGFDVNNKGNYE